MTEFTGLHFALMGGNLIAGTAIGWLARSLTAAKTKPPQVEGNTESEHAVTTSFLVSLSQSTDECSKGLRTFEHQLDQVPDEPNDGLIAEIRGFGQSYSDKLHADVSTLENLADRKDAVIRQVITEMNRHTEHVDQFNRSVGVQIDQCLPEKIKNLLSVALSELLDCNHHLVSELNSARRDLEQQRKELADARRDARIDPLTKIANRRSFEESHRAVHAKFARNGESYSIVMFDLDRFKTINDTYGHATGDVVLQVFAKVLQDAVRMYDVVARVGGEEFVVLLAKTTQKDCTLIAERIRRQTSTKTVRQGDKSIGFTVSAGVALATSEDTPEAMMKRADAALYQAKRGGRNRVQFGFSESLSEEETAAQPVGTHF